MRRSSLVVVLAVGALLVPLAVYASHQFNDVPDSHTFHNAIDWMKDNNITVGCNPPANTNYCPDDNVTRGQMAAFMKRLAENNVVDAATLDGKDSSEYLAVTSAETFDYFGGPNVALDVAGTPIVETSVSASVAGHVLAIGNAAVGNGTAGGFFTIWIEVDDGACGITGIIPSNSAPGAVSYASPTVAGEDYGLGVSSLVAVGAGTHTVTLCGAHNADSGAAFNASVIGQFLGEASLSVATLSTDSGSDGPQG